MWSVDAYLAALRFAASSHAGQTVPGTTLPYVVHVVSVAAEVVASLDAEAPARPDLAVQVALLHDTLEDTNVTFDDLASAFGRDVADGVAALSKRSDLPKSAAMADSLRRILEGPPELARVKLADRITNLAPPPGHWTPQRCTAYHAEAGEILAALGPSCPFLASRLAQRRATYEQYCG